jgi:hypothetical protein
MMQLQIFLSLFLTTSVIASPITDVSGLNYHSLQARQQNLPLLKLPYGTWQAAKYDAKNDVTALSPILLSLPFNLLSRRSISSETFVSLHRQLVTYAGQNPPLQHQTQRSKLAPMADHAYKAYQHQCSPLH